MFLWTKKLLCLMILAFNMFLLMFRYKGGGMVGGWLGLVELVGREKMAREMGSYGSVLIRVWLFTVLVMLIIGRSTE